VDVDRRAAGLGRVSVGAEVDASFPRATRACCAKQASAMKKKAEALERWVNAEKGAAKKRE
jgi:hypothetical protein